VTRTGEVLRVRLASITVGALLAVATAAEQPPAGVSLVGLPGQGCATVEWPTELREDWGSVSVRVEAGGQAQTGTVPVGDPRERVYSYRTRGQAGPCEVETRVLRVPSDPRPSDLLRTSVRNVSTEATTARVVVSPKTSATGLTLSPDGLSAGARQLVSLPGDAQPTLPTNAWGLASGAGALPGWAQPNEPCDPAFRNIRVGWRGDPITYRFRVEAHGQRTVVLGLCESHWDQPAQRPLLLQVEGAADVRVDPIGEWGRHVPRCLGFSGRDVDGDGMLTVTSVTPTDAPDRNSILNAVWVFPAGTSQDMEAVKRGERTAAAEFYVDCGGDPDPSLYAVGDIAYDLQLPPGAGRTLTFLVACDGATAPEGVADEAAAEGLLTGAQALWAEWYDSGSAIRVPDEGVQASLDAAIAAIAMAQGQASKYLIPRSSLQGDLFSYPDACDIIAALDLTGRHRQAEALLLMLWDQGLPEPIAQWGQREDGTWPCPQGNWGVQGRVLSVLSEHYLLTGDRAWLGRVYPSVEKGADRLITALDEHGGQLPSPPELRAGCGPNVWAARGLTGAAKLSGALGRTDAAHRFGEAGKRLAAILTDHTPPGVDALRACLEGESSQGFLPAPGDATRLPDAAAGARVVALVREMLVDDSTTDLRLLGGVPGEWLQSGTGTVVEGLPTAFGPISFRARLTEPDVLKLALAPMRVGSVTVALPFVAPGGTVEATGGWRAEIVDDGRAALLHPAGVTGVITVRQG